MTEPNVNFIRTALEYDAVSWYRKRWFAVTCLLVCAPLLVVIASSGDVFALRDGMVYKYSEKARRNLMIIGAAFTGMGLVRIFLPH